MPSKRHPLLLMDRKLLLRTGLSLFDTLVAEVEADIGGDHNKIGPIEPEGQVKGAGHKLGDKATHIAELNENHKQQALALGGAGAVGTHDRQRPRNTKRHNHKGFKNTSDTSHFHGEHFSFYAAILLSKACQKDVTSYEYNEGAAWERPYR